MPDMIKKQFIGKAEVDDDERTITATISTGIVDRENEVLLPKGAEFEQYLKNPVVLWAHDYRETPIAKAQWIKKGNKYIQAKAKFADTVKADEIYQLYKGGFLKAFSVGFLPKETHNPTPEEIKKHPEWAEAKLIYDKWELLEFSAVPVPANPEALAVAVKDLNVSAETQGELGIEEVWTVPEDTSTYCFDLTNIGDVTGTGMWDVLGRDYADSLGIPYMVEIEPVLKPEETEKYIRIPVRSCDITATITISAEQGIKGLYCGKVKKVATYLFAIAKGWTMAKAKAWVKEHDSGKSETAKTEDVSIIKPEIRIARPIIMRRPFRVRERPKVDNAVERAITRLSGRVY